MVFSIEEVRNLTSMTVCVRVIGCDDESMK